MTFLKKSGLCLLLIYTCTASLLAQEVAEVITHNTSYALTEKGLREKVNVKVQINNREGLFMTEVSIPYNPRVSVENISAKVFRVDGKFLSQLKRKNITDASSISDISLYEDERVKRFELSHNVFPFVLEYSYETLSSEYLQIANWTPVIGIRVPVKTATLSIEAPPGFKYRVKEYMVPPGTKVSTTNGEKMVWNTSYKGSEWEPEYFSQSIEQIIPRVTIIPEQFNYGIAGSFESWNTFGQWVHKLAQGTKKLPNWEKQRVKELITGLETPKEIINALYHYMQDHTRYINVTIDIGGFKPYPASYVSTNKYGDCKALTNYMQALLNEAGIDSYCVDVYAGKTPETFDEEIPRQAFNHVILAVPLEKDTVWLENTDNTSPFGYLGTFTQNRRALWVDGTESQLVDIPALKPEEVGSEHQIKLNLSTNGLGEAIISSRYMGRDFERLSSVNDNGDDSDFIALMRKLMPYSRAKFDGATVLDRDRDDRNIRCLVSASLQPYTRRFGETQVLFLPKVKMPSMEKPAERKTGLFLASPLRQQEQLIIENSGSAYAEFELEDLKIESSFGSYEVSSENSEGQLTVTQKFVLIAGQYPLSEYQAFYDFLQQVKETQRKTYIKLKSQ